MLLFFYYYIIYDFIALFIQFLYFLWFYLTIYSTFFLVIATWNYIWYHRLKGASECVWDGWRRRRIITVFLSGFIQLNSFSKFGLLFIHIGSNLDSVSTTSVVSFARSIWQTFFLFFSWQPGIILDRIRRTKTQAGRIIATTLVTLTQTVKVSAVIGLKIIKQILLIVHRAMVYGTIMPRSRDKNEIQDCLSNDVEKVSTISL